MRRRVAYLSLLLLSILAVIGYLAMLESNDKLRLMFEDAAALPELLLGRRNTVFLPVLAILIVLVRLLKRLVRRAPRSSIGVGGFGRNSLWLRAWQKMNEIDGTAILVIGFIVFMAGLVPLVMFAEDWSGRRTEWLWSRFLILTCIVSGGYSLFWLGATVRLRQKLLNVPSAAQLLRDDRRAPILYLRSFRDDYKQLPSSATAGSAVTTGSVHLFASLLGGLMLAIPGAVTTQEEVLAGQLSVSGPLIAIGDPNERLPALGATRLYPGDEWPAVVSDLMSRAVLVVFRPGSSQGLRWEVERARQIVPAERVVFWLPGPLSKRAYTEYCRQLEPLLPCPLPPYRPAMFLSFSNNWKEATLVADLGTVIRAAQKASSEGVSA
jgi:hypothetical protein